MKKFIYGAMSLGLLFTACSSDVLTETSESNIKKDVDRTYYLRVAIHGDNAAFTRAYNDQTPTLENGDFADGVDNGDYKESAVNTVYFVFYDEQGNVVGDLVQANDLEWTNGDPNSNTVEKYGQTIVRVDVPKASEEPASVICYINPIAPQSLQFDLGTIQTVLRDRVWRSSYGFAMSNSVYYETQTSTEPRIDVPINGDALKNTYDEAKADDNPAMDIYVERYAAKLSFSVADGDAADGQAAVQDYTTNSPEINDDGTAGVSVPVSLHFNQLRWALNAESKNTYMIKSFRKESPTGNILPDNYTFGELNLRITANLKGSGENIEYVGGSETEESEQWQWNNSSYHRSYWAMSPAYFTAEYPEVSSDVENMPDCPQVYYTFKQLNNSGTNQAGFDMNTKTGYFKETTVGSKALTSNNPKAAVASVILTGQYEVTVNNENKGNVTFYTYNKSTDGKDLVYFEANENGESAVGAGESMLSRFISATTVLYVKETLEDGTENYVAATKDQILPYVEIGKHVSLKETSEDEDPIKISSRLRTMVLKSNAATANSGLYVATPTAYVEIVANSYVDENDNTVTITPSTGQMTVDQANENIYQQIGSCAMYKDGMAYFNIPVMHYGWYRSDNPNKDKALSDIEWSDVHIGDFGIVRNHSYNVEVSELRGLGNAIADGDDPIVPPADTESYYVKYRVNILKWAVVPTQSVKL